ncbi:MAG: hypothetical protein Q8K60_06190, partial [Parachlamydiaceae bacterium]|nr:hypothetical protein [Parachlamydiaceae bacterium]
MSKKSMDFHGSVNLDQKVMDQLENYLKERESYLAHRLSEISKDLTVLYSSSPSLTHKRPKLSAAVDEFCKVLREVKHEDKINLQLAFKHVLHEVNHVFWEFAEVLE